MPIDEVNVVRLCKECGTEIETIKVKKDNMRLFSNELVWCPQCQAERPEVRDIAGRRQAVQQEQASYPQLRPAR
jgi:Zn finger protein HypA/HybF involved in hydrogenase expression